MVREPFTLTKQHLLKISEWEHLDRQLIAGFTTRLGGVGKPPYEFLNVGLHVADDDEVVIKNRQHVATKLNIPLDQWVVGEQVHDANIKKVSTKDAGMGSKSLKTAISGVDGLYTDQTDILLVSLYADCVPLYFYTPKQKMIGLAHAGWKGTVNLIGPKMVDHWTTDEGVRPEDIFVAIGPAISLNEYEVDENVIQYVSKLSLNDEGDNQYSRLTRPGHYLLDLKKVNELLLLRSGIPKDNIVKSEFCTASDTNLFFSHRKEGGRTGRMMSYIGMTTK